MEQSRGKEAQKQTKGMKACSSMHNSFEIFNCLKIVLIHHWILDSLVTGWLSEIITFRFFLGGGRKS